MNSLIEQLFANLDRWRHLPAYQLERRADIFFSVYLPEFLKEKRGYEVQGIIPEFPIRVGTVYSKDDINKSFKVDYLVKLNNPSRVLFVELKTDDSSRREKQDWYLTEAQKKGMRSLLHGISQIYAATNAKDKYRHLLRSLEEANLIRLSSGDSFEVVEDENEISILYLQPNSSSNSDTVTFDELAEFVGKKQDELSQRFAKSLREWARVTAGANGT